MTTESAIPFEVDPEALHEEASKLGWKSSLWGISPVSPIHFGMDNLFIIQKTLLSAVGQHRILLADSYAMFTRHLSKSDVRDRADYYEHYLRSCCGLKCEYIRGSTFQLQTNYVDLLFRILSCVSPGRARQALPAALKNNSESETLYKTIAPVVQVLDALVLKPTVVFADSGQRRIYSLAENLGGAAKQVIQDHNSSQNEFPKIIYCHISHDIQGRPLSQSTTASRISIHESRNSLSEKVRRMYAPPPNQPLARGRINALLEYYRWSVFPWIDKHIEIPINDKESLKFTKFEDFEYSYNNAILHPMDCKTILEEFLWSRIELISDTMGKTLCSWVDIEHIQSQFTDSKIANQYGVNLCSTK